MQPSPHRKPILCKTQEGREGCRTHGKGQQSRGGGPAPQHPCPGFPACRGNPRPAVTRLVGLVKGHWMQRAKGVSPKSSMSSCMLCP